MQPRFSLFWDCPFEVGRGSVLWCSPLFPSLVPFSWQAFMELDPLFFLFSVFFFLYITIPSPGPSPLQELEISGLCLQSSRFVLPLLVPFLHPWSLCVGPNFFFCPLMGLLFCSNITSVPRSPFLCIESPFTLVRSLSDVKRSFIPPLESFLWHAFPLAQFPRFSRPPRLKHFLFQPSPPVTCFSPLVRQMSYL